MAKVTKILGVFAADSASTANLGSLLQKSATTSNFQAVATAKPAPVPPAQSGANASPQAAPAQSTTTSKK